MSTLVLDGVFARNRAGVLNFHATRPLTALDVAEVLATVELRIKRLLDRRGLGDDDDDVAASDTWADEAPVLAGLAAASVQGTVALGPHQGARLRRLGDPPESVEASRTMAVTRGRTASICMRASSTRRAAGAARARVSLRAASACDAGAAPLDRRGAGAAGAPAAVA